MKQAVFLYETTLTLFALSHFLIDAIYQNKHMTHEKIQAHINLDG